MPPLLRTSSSSESSFPSHSTADGVYPANLDEPPLDEGTVYGRLADSPRPVEGAETATLAYSRIPTYCVRAARAIDAFEAAFEKNASS